MFGAAPKDPPRGLACYISSLFCKENGIPLFFQASHLLLPQFPSVTAHSGEQLGRSGSADLPQAARTGSNTGF